MSDTDSAGPHAAGARPQLGSGAPGADIADVGRVAEVEKKYDSGLRTRALGPRVALAVFWLSLVFALYHYITAGYTVPVDHWHMGIHLSGVLLLIFVMFPLLRTRAAMEGGHAPSAWRPGNVPLYDWAFAAVGIATSLYIGFAWNGVDISVLGFEWKMPDQSLRQGDPAFADVLFGSALIVVLLEAVRRTLGPIVPIIIIVFSSYALFGRHIPSNVLAHPGVDWPLFVNNMYFPSEGIFGVTLWIVSTVVFHFVLFGILAQRMGLGQFFVDIATVIAGRYTGGLAKVSVVSSAFFGTISGSSIANTVSTGSLTIPNMKRMGYPGHLAGGVEAAASAGGQITPPIMGAAAFVMAEFLEVPYTTVVLAAAVPAAMHYIGVLCIVHFHARRLGLEGVPRDEIPKLWAVLARGWPTALPLVVLIYVLFSGYSPYMAAFWGITTALAVGFLNPYHRISIKDVADAAVLGVRYALAVGAVCAAIGIVVGVVNTTGLGFRLGFLVTAGAQTLAEGVMPAVSLVPFSDFQLPDVTLFLSLVLIAITCILMGAGLPTTALYIMLATVAQPALANMGIPPLAAHLFVLYYGVISEITPPVCASAYAAGGIAGANPFRTGISAFTLGIAKLIVPMVFVYSPAMLIVIEERFTWGEFLATTLSCAGGVFLLAAGIAGFWFAAMPLWARWLVALAGLFLVSPAEGSNAWALGFLAPVAVQQFLGRRAQAVPAPA